MLIGLFEVDISSKQKKKVLRLMISTWLENLFCLFKHPIQMLQILPYVLIIIYNNHDDNTNANVDWFKKLYSYS